MRYREHPRSHMNPKKAANSAIRRGCFFGGSSYSDREEEGIVQHQHDHAGSHKRKYDAARSEPSALILDELEAHDKDKNGDGC